MSDIEFDVDGTLLTVGYSDVNFYDSVRGLHQSKVTHAQHSYGMKVLVLGAQGEASSVVVAGAHAQVLGVAGKDSFRRCRIRRPSRCGRSAGREIV